MSNEKGPRWQVPGRDVLVRKETPRGGVPAFVEEECTGKYEGEDLARMRSRRPTPERISKLETKHDELVKAFNDHRAESNEAMGRVEGKLDTTLAFITDQGKTQRTRISANAKTIAAVVGAIAAIVIAAIKVLS